MLREIHIKRGDTRTLQLTVLNDDGTPVDLTSVTLSCQLVSATDELVATPPISLTAAEGVATILLSNTSQWPIGALRGDIKAVWGSSIQHSETFGVRVNRSVTA